MILILSLSLSLALVLIMLGYDHALHRDLVQDIVDGSVVDYRKCIIQVFCILKFGSLWLLCSWVVVAQYSSKALWYSTVV